MWCGRSSSGRLWARLAVALLFVVPASARTSAAAVAGELDEERYFLERAYRDALTRWSSGAPGAADAAVAQYNDAQEQAGSFVHGQSLELEGMDLMRAGPGGQLEIRHAPDQEIRCALGAELHTVELLERRSPDLLPALAIFHLEVHLDQMSRQPRPWLESINRSRLVGLLESYRKFVDERFEGSERVRRLLGLHQAWMVVGTSQVALGWSRPMQRAVEAFDRAREIVPGAMEPRYWTALVYEKLDRYDLSTKELRSLADEYPGAAEFRLRLALGLRRQGRDAAAVEAFRDLLAGAAPRRARALAYQELGSLLAERSGGWSEAVSELRRGAEEFPENDRLRIALSHLLADRALGGDAPPAESAELLYESEMLAEGILAAATSRDAPRSRPGVRGSPRLRYELPDPALVGPPMEQAAQSVLEWRAALHEAIQTLSPKALAKPRCLEQFEGSRRRAGD